MLEGSFSDGVSAKKSSILVQKVQRLHELNFDPVCAVNQCSKRQLLGDRAFAMANVKGFWFWSE